MITFDTLNFIESKKSGNPHKPGEIRTFIKLLVHGEIPDYQVSAWLMAVCFNGLDFKETRELTKAIAESGKVLAWDTEGPPVVDKHSTGGIGDSVTLIAAPLAAAMGMRMGKHSGRGLGHTGGTIDKLESIPGFNTSLSEKEFRKVVDKVGCAVTGQDENMTPADGILYSLRDVTATVNEESLIASSVMSKKIAGGASHILLDVKVGSGAFMKDVETARSLAKLMVKLGKAAGRNVRAVMSRMDAPLGRAVGNALEVTEAIRIMKNEVPGDDPLRILAIDIVARLASMCGFGTIRNTRSRADMLLRNGSALAVFGDMARYQGGNPAVIKDPGNILPSASKIIRLGAWRYGFINTMDALTIGELVRDLGGGRKSKSDRINPAVGVFLHKRPGDKVSKNDIILEIHTDGVLDDDEIITRASNAVRITRQPSDISSLIIK